MPHPKLEDVFKLSGLPVYTFVRPVEYEKLLIALRTPGRGVVIEGPSGIGKTTAVKKALEDLGISGHTLLLSARKSEDRDLISELPQISGTGVVIIDDFHRLNDPIRGAIADHLKALADEEAIDSKIIILGINKAGQSLVHFARDLNTRIDIIRFEANPEFKVQELVEKGEKTLNIQINTMNEIVSAANGSFFIAQMLCHESCLSKGILEAQESTVTVDISFEVVKQRVMDNLSISFMDIARRFASGTKLRREGRAPYLHILRWLADANDWSLSLDRIIRTQQELRGSISQVVEKHHLEHLLDSSPDFSEVLHYDKSTRTLTVEDPQFVFFLRNLLWNKFAEHVGSYNIQFESKYDFALSFAGADRDYARRLDQHLAEMEFEVFYDKNEEHRILAENVEDYLGPIYRSEAAFVVCFLGPLYPTRIWAKFESENFRSRFGSGSVIPIWFTTAPPGMFDESSRFGGFMFDPDNDPNGQLVHIADTLRKKLADYRHQLFP